jgi:bifunctional non-homologous end joining protein LigD
MVRQSKLPKRLQPMLATLVDAPFDSRDWVFETKWDGFRVVAVIEKRRVTLYSRNGLIVSDRYMPVAKALERLKQDAVIDGELVAFDAHGISRFQLLQNALRATADLGYCVFDIMFLAGQDLRGLPLVARKERLAGVLPKDRLLSYSEHHPEHGKRLFKQAQQRGLEGIVAKRAGSRYLSGARSKDWLKIKTGKRQEAVIVGFTAPRRSRPYFGALVLAVREEDRWRYGVHPRDARGDSRQARAVAHPRISLRRARER